MSEACQRGHEWTDANTVTRPVGDGRSCRECRRQANLRRDRAAGAARGGKYSITEAELASVNPSRFWPRVVIGNPAECWPWIGPVNRSGYGKTFITGRRTYTSSHRVAWVLSGRRLAPTDELDHLCQNPVCVNPNHLEPVSPTENRRRIQLRRVVLS